MLYCKSCHQQKPPEAFHKGRGKRGYSYKCRDCSPIRPSDCYQSGELLRALEGRGQSAQATAEIMEEYAKELARMHPHTATCRHCQSAFEVQIIGSGGGGGWFLCENCLAERVAEVVAERHSTTV